MSISAKIVFDSLPKARKLMIKKESKILISEYKNLQEFRRSLGMTQSELASDLSISQVNISKLEKRTDMHISTLRKYVEALGCQLEIKIKMPNESEVMINNIK
ncbi:MAG: helix-turn-helix transcriptional regulator [Saprospiraceae bacterium]